MHGIHGWWYLGGGGEQFMTCPMKARNVNFPLGEGRNPQLLLISFIGVNEVFIIKTINTIVNK
jgi:hypothetical protein